MHLCLSSQHAMKEHYSHVAAFIEACGQLGVDMVARMEECRPDTPITAATLRPLRRLYTQHARTQVFAAMPTKGATLKSFSTAVDKAQ